MGWNEDSNAGHDAQRAADDARHEMNMRMSSSGNDRKYGTPFIESEVLLSIIYEDVDNARALLQEMPPGKRHSLEHHCAQIINFIQHMREDEE
jgi:hypothetical protein